MFLLGHLGIVLLAYAPVAYLLARRGDTVRMWAGAAGLLAFAVAPDVDVAFAFLDHRGPTHTLWAALALGLLTVPVAWLVSDVARRPTSNGAFGFGIGTFAVLAHLLGDVLTPMGIRPFAPLTTSTYSLALVPAGDPMANRLLLAAGVLAFGLAVVVSRSRAQSSELAVVEPGRSTVDTEPL